MKIFSRIYLFLFLSCTISCTEKLKNNTFDVDPQIILKSFQTWWNYNSSHINLLTDFNAFDDNSQMITKKIFLEKLKTGGYIPIKIISSDSISSYQLYQLQKNDAEGIKETIKQIGAIEYEFFKKEGTLFPEVNFVDIEGNAINKETSKGKYLILKCWFIHCQVCVEEMPELNLLVEKYKKRKDVFFVSLAMDSKEDLKKFISKKEFKYLIVPNQEDYMTNKLGVKMYPTHFVIDKNGRIIKILTSQKDLEIILKKVLKD